MKSSHFRHLYDFLNAFAILLLTSRVKYSYSSSTSNDRTEYHIKSLIEWVRSKGGYLHPSIEIRKADEKSSYYGIFTNSDIKAKELLIKIPKECLITAGGTKIDDMIVLPYDAIWLDARVKAINDDEHTMDVILEEYGTELFGIDIELAGKSGDITMECRTIRNLIKEMKLGDDSDYAPYANYLLDQNNGTIPSFWSDAGKSFLLHVQSDLLPPHGMVGWSWTDICNGNKDPLEEKAAMAQVSRGWDDFVVPLYDMINHRGGNWTNTENSHMKWNLDIEVTSSHDLKSGEQLYNNYLFGTNGNIVSNYYATPELFRDYG